MSGFAVLPLRLFLGITFLYAAIQKLLDPGFLTPGAPTYIGAQMLAFSRGSPIQWLIHPLTEHAVAVGILTVITEGLLGLLVLLGLFTRPAALAGMALSMSFFLSASWQTYPYFFGSDIVFVVCWLTLAITGPGVFALDTVLEAPIIRMVRARLPERYRTPTVFVLTGVHHTQTPAAQETHVDAENVETLPASETTRRRVTRGEALAGSLGAVILIALGLRPRGTSTTQATAQLAGGPVSPMSTPGTMSTPGASPPSTAIPSGATRIGNVSQLPVNSAGTVKDPKTGDPAIIIHASGSTFYAYDAVCTHAGCTVDYDAQQRLLVCPCHGGSFDPAHGAQVVSGPPPSPLSPVNMKIDSQGNIYIV
ncbi:MAG: hypothetical protein NVSMB52_02570 [Chloroflexota bacterium]